MKNYRDYMSRINMNYVKGLREDGRITDEELSGIERYTYPSTIDLIDQNYSEEQKQDLLNKVETILLS